MRIAAHAVGRRTPSARKDETMSRKQDFDPQAIPNFGGSGRMGEIDPNEPEEQQSSAQIQGTDPDIQTDPAAGVEAAEAAAPPGQQAPAGRAGTASAPPPPVENPRTQRDDRARGETHVHSDSPEPPGSIRGRPEVLGGPS
jgi:hypothetical protein